MYSHRFDELMTAKLSGTLDENGQQELAELLLQHPERVQELALLEQYWKEVPAAEAPAADIFSKMMDKATAPRSTVALKPARWWRWAAAAAVLGLLCTVGYRMATGPRQQKDAGMQLVQTGNGERRHFRLSDGSVVHLNASSRLKASLTPESRELWLEGEAYFEVAKDAARPFTVHAATLNIHALGTAFNVKAYPGEALYETTLLEGAVEVYLDKIPDSKVRLRPYEKVAFHNSNGISSPEKKLIIKPVVSKAIIARTAALPAIDSTVMETAWVSNHLRFESLSFEQLAKLLERWYGVQIIFRNEAVKSYVFSGSFVSETVTQALKALQLTEDFHFDSNGTQIIIY